MTRRATLLPGMPSRKVKRLRVVGIRGGTHKAFLQAGTVVVPCAIGRNGVTWHKREGDGRTPAGTFGLLDGYFRADRQQRVQSPALMRAIKRCDGWCDDPQNGQYNRKVTLPFAASHEELSRKDRVYDIIVVMDHNQNPRIKGLGSAIFFHLANSSLGGTAGCVAIDLPAMRRLLPRLGRHCRMNIG